MTDNSSDDQRLLHLMRLNLVDGIGPRLQQSLLQTFPNPERIFAASSEQLRQVPGIGHKLAAALRDPQTYSDAQRELQRCRDSQLPLFFHGNPNYPSLLKEITDPPPVLYCRGELRPQDELAVAIVGSRRCTLYGKQQAERLARALARAGMTIVSGLARGIDAAAHRGALSVEGRTIAVMATGLATVYPPEHAELATEIAHKGALLSESPLDQKPVAGLFPQRNRIISGLSLGVILVEATRNSGALHTARHAMEQGREVFAVPGRIDSFASQGCLNLIRDGATLVQTPDDVLESLGPLISPVRRTETEEVHSPRELNLSQQERQVLNAIHTEPQHVDAVLANLDLEPSRILATLTVLEMKRLLRRLPGGYLVRISQ